MIGYIKFKRDKFGVCNLCRKEKPLTWDHVPPRGGIEVTPMEMKSLLQQITDQDVVRNYTISQNGVKYRTICKECNQFLGNNYDSVLNEFSNGVSKYLKTNLILPNIIYFESRPTAIIRSVLGHLVASKTILQESVFDLQVRSFLFDVTKPIPSEIKVFYWIYPYQYISIIRDIVMPAERGKFNQVGMFQVLKYFPLAYLVTDLEHYQGLDELTLFRARTIGELEQIPINIRSVRPPEWPDNVDDGNFISGGASLESSIRARPRVAR